ncbi:hypothetical protein GALMADRAFT_230594 [Galerina marginata CBS 339.88]|uniref:Uncharacterized protein n=1 Tax=Galerina marginata (strain CBS 339.88) TaxID=685588 RepID=A0A067SS89_GALM3|nr:hypothetical protein GALMADRAFT_230594 [Galerina marginata CBS 339.88]
MGAANRASEHPCTVEPKLGMHLPSFSSAVFGLNIEPILPPSPNITTRPPWPAASPPPSPPSALSGYLAAMEESSEPLSRRTNSSPLCSSLFGPVFGPGYGG